MNYFNISIIEIINLIIFILCLVSAIAEKNLLGICGYICAILWLVAYILKDNDLID